MTTQDYIIKILSEHLYQATAYKIRIEIRKQYKEERTMEQIGGALQRLKRRGRVKNDGYMWSINNQKD